MVPGHSEDKDPGLRVPVLQLEGEVDLGQPQLPEIQQHLIPQEVYDLLLSEAFIGV